MNCDEIRELLPAYGRDQQPSLAVRRHLASCRSCREDLVAYKDLVSSLHSLRFETTEVPAQLTRALIAVPSSENVLGNVRIHVSRNRVAYVGGAVAVAGALGATLWRARSRRLAAA